MQKKLLLRLFITVLIGLFFIGCVSSGSSAKPSDSISEFSSQRKTDKLNETLMLSSVTQKGVLKESYAIGPEDLLEIDAYNIEELKKTVRVNSSKRGQFPNSTDPFCGQARILPISSAEARCTPPGIPVPRSSTITINAERNLNTYLVFILFFSKRLFSYRNHDLFNGAPDKLFLTSLLIA